MALSLWLLRRFRVLAWCTASPQKPFSPAWPPSPLLSTFDAFRRCKLKSDNYRNAALSVASLSLVLETGKRRRIKLRFIFRGCPSNSQVAA